MGGVYTVTLEDDDKTLEDYMLMEGSAGDGKAYAYTPDKGSPKLPIGDATHARLAVQAFVGKFRGQHAQIPSDARAGVKSKIAGAIRKFYKGDTQKYYLSWLNSGKKPDEKPASEAKRFVHEMYIPLPAYDVADEPDFPNVPPAPGVNMTALLSGDDKPVFITRPLAILDEVSDNGLPYNRAVYEAIRTQVLNKRPAARLGHVHPGDKSSAFPPDDGYWIGVVEDSEIYGKPTLFGKCYTVPHRAAREMVVRRSATGTSLSNSIYGEVTEVEDEQGNRVPVALNIETIDFVPEERAALQALGGDFKVTSEMKEDDMPTEVQEAAAQLKEAMSKCKPDEVREAVNEAGFGHKFAEAHMQGDCKECHEMKRSLAEAYIRDSKPEDTYKFVSEAGRKAFAEAYAKETNMTLRAKEADDKDADDKKEVAEMKRQIGEMATANTEMQTIIKRYQRQEFDDTLDKTVASFFAEWRVHTVSGEEKLNALRKNLRTLTVAEMAGSTKLEDIKAAADKAWTDVKPLAEMTMAALAGPNAVTGQMTGGQQKAFGYDPSTGRYDDDTVAQVLRQHGGLGGRSATEVKKS